MFCWSCGSQLNNPRASCPQCGAAPARAAEGSAAVRIPRELERDPGRNLRVCAGCGYRGEGVPYFRRATHAALLVGATILTYGLGGLLYWLVRRNERVCPSCGISWSRSRPLAAPLASDTASESGAPAEAPARASPMANPGSHAQLPPAGGFRRVTGVLLALLAVLLLTIGIVEAEAAPVIMSAMFGLSGVAAFGWGWKAREARREAVLRRTQGQVLHLARRKQGVLTATDVASELDVSLDGAERILLSLDDGFRVRSDVTSEGLLVFEFREMGFDRRPTSAARRWTEELRTGTDAPAAPPEGNGKVPPAG